MKLLLLVLLACASLPAQRFSVGLRVGAPLTEAFELGQEAAAGRFRATANNYILGPAFEVRLPLRLSLEFDILYRRIGVEQVEGANLPDAGLRASQFEFPLLLKYRFVDGAVSPYVGGGPSFNRITGVSEAIRRPGTIVGLSELSKDSTAGFTLAGGIEMRAPGLRLTPELRYTRRGARNFLGALAGLPGSNLNQVDFLLGIHF